MEEPSLLVCQRGSWHPSRLQATNRNDAHTVLAYEVAYLDKVRRAILFLATYFFGNVTLMTLDSMTVPPKSLCQRAVLGSTA